MVMNGLMEAALGADWKRLPPALQAHYRTGVNVDAGHLDIEFPRFMFPVMALLQAIGALVSRRGRRLPTTVEKYVVGERQVWKRRIAYPGGRVASFDSFWVHAGGNELIEYVNPLLGLQMAVWLDGRRLRYRGIRFVLRVGRWHLPIPEWLALGHTEIVEEAIHGQRFAMDFRLTHPLFGQVFRYSGVFETREAASAG
jgi:hypothetical protein